MKQEILSQFDSDKIKYDDFRIKINSLISDLLKGNSINVHQISCRLKEKKSLSKKIDKKYDKYKALSDITDLVGIRVITYLESQVDLIAEIIETEFEIDRINSIDKRLLKIDQFGYRSLHFVAELTASRINLTEYKLFKGLKFEIQIRSILQHAWAEIEHDLGYKGISAIPDDYKRSFNRLSALLETADIEFDRLKRELTNYELKVHDLIAKDSSKVNIDQASLISIIQTNSTLLRAKSIIIEKLSPEIRKQVDYRFYVDRLTRMFNIQTIRDLEESLKANKKEYLSFVEEYCENISYDIVADAIALFYYMHYLASKTGNIEFIKSYIDIGEYKVGIYENPNLYIEIYRKATATNIK